MGIYRNKSSISSHLLQVITLDMAGYSALRDSHHGRLVIDTIKKGSSPESNIHKQRALASGSEHSEKLDFPIVGIGASAGGLEALELFLRNVPENSGMAFVVIQHLDPSHKTMLTELLQRATGMKTVQAEDQMQVKPNCVYIIPPNKEMSILHGTLHLFAPVTPRGVRLPIDFFFRSLAEDRREQSIGVILSGMGSDGTLGLKAIKGKAGVTLVQEPATAKFDSMPRSAISAGLADLVAPAEKLPGKIIDFLRHARSLFGSEVALEEKDKSSLDKVVLLLRDKTGQDFSLYKKNTVYRRIERRMGIHQLDRIDAYVRYLQENPQEIEFLFNELLIGVTSFFRDPAAWEILREEVFPAIFAHHPAGRKIRAWSTGCSTGEEAYSLAITFKEALAKIQPKGRFTLQIFATDLDRDAIDNARKGIYPPNIAADLCAERLERYFTHEENGYRIGTEIREMVTFAPQNVIMDPPFTKLDILICRNLLIYLTPELQKKLLPLFHYSLNPGGFLFLGSAETVSTHAGLFTPLNLKARIFRWRESVLPAEPLAFPALFVPATLEIPKELKTLTTTTNLQSLAEQVLLQHFSPAAVLVNDQGDILYISGRTGKYLEPAAGKANWNIFAMAREGLRFDLGIAFQKALRHKEVITVRGVKIGEPAATQSIDLTVKAIEDPEALRGMVMIVFNDVALPAENKPPTRAKGPASDNILVAELEQELFQSHQALQTLREEMQSSQEELKSTNEELQSTNEELQSTNEELTTSREELQSLNEELQSVNAEQQAKMDELAHINNDMHNLLNSTEIVTVFLDNNLHVRRFTPGADKLFKLIPGDVGRPLSDFSSDLFYPKMLEETREVLRTLVFSEKQIAATNDRWFSVRIMPYRTMDDVIGGVVITFTNITATKKLEAELRAENARLKKLLKSDN